MFIGAPKGNHRLRVNSRVRGPAMDAVRLRVPLHAAVLRVVGDFGDRVRHVGDVACHLGTHSHMLLLLLNLPHHLLIVLIYLYLVFPTFLLIFKTWRLLRLMQILGRLLLNYLLASAVLQGRVRVSILKTRISQLRQIEYLKWSKFP